MKHLSLLLLSLLLPLALNADNYKMPINKHFIIVVDQTIPTRNTNMNGIYNALSCWLQGKDPSQYLNTNSSVVPTPLVFDAKNDVISLFAFGLPGDGKRMNSTFGRIHAECYGGAKSEQYVFDDVVKSLIHKRERYLNGECIKAISGQKTNISLSEFIGKDMRTLFNFTDPLHVAISQNSGITMSHFVYPLIMSFVSKEETANEYYLFLVSDFKSGQYSNNDENDRNTLRGLVSGKNNIVKYFDSQIKAMRAPFVQAEYLHFQVGDLGVKGVRLIHKDIVMKSQLHLNSSLELHQKNGSLFNLGKAYIAFDKDASTTIDSIGVAIMEGDNILSYRTIVRGDEDVSNLLTEGREYEIPSQESLDLGKSSLDDITVKYIFFTMSHDSDGNPVLPVSLTSQQTISKENITYINEQLRNAMEIIIAVLVIIALITISIIRGRKKHLGKLNLGHFAQKYVDVTEKEGALELPCWFFKEGELSQSIRIKGTVNNANSLSYGGNTILRARLQDGSPSGLSYYINGKDASHFVNIDLKDRAFEFNIDMRIDLSKINVRAKNRCHVSLDFEIESSLFGFMKHSDFIQNVEPIEFFLIHDLGNSWVGFDPGTTGSCVTVGSPGGTPDKPNITLVANTIVPSKLVLNKDITGSNIADLVPGEDYVYGIEAEQNWAAHIHAHRPCYQSIKKLLGYKNSKDDMIVANFGNKKMSFTGLDLAHLLVKGLYKDMSTHLNMLSDDDRRRYAGRYSTPRRAVVAIPNNYTLPKILEMVESVRRLNKFEEVRYIYGSFVC